MNTVFRVFAYLKRYPGLAIAQLACAVLATLLILVFPMIIARLIDDVIPNGLVGQLLPMGLIALGAFALREALDSGRIQLNNTFEQKVIFDLRSDLYEHIQRLPLQWFDNHPTGDTMTCVSEDVQSMERVLIDGIEQGVVALLQILVVGTMMLILNPALTLAALVPIPLLIIGAWLYTKNRQRYAEQRKATGEMNSLLHDNIAGIRQIKAYALEESEHAEFNKASNRVRKTSLRVMRAWALYKPSMNFFNSLGHVLVLCVGGWLLIRAAGGGPVDDSGIGELTAFLYLVTAHFYEPFMRLHQLNQLVMSGRAAADRVFGVLDSDPELDLDSGDDLARVNGHVVFDKVSFAYNERASTLSEVAIEAKPGQSIALVGSTGAGKSTVINLLARFYEYSGGSIKIDGVEITTLNKRSLRSQIGYVTQESFLFNGSVRDNLLIAKREAGDEELWNALEIANAAGFVRRLPEGLDTHVGERGVKLSVGEKQRISIARALLKNPPILLLDEATASVDTETEREIQEALEKLMVNRTSFVIAHRLSTVRNADRIYVLERGKVIEEGTHQQLLDQDGEYAKLCRTAFLENED